MMLRQGAANTIYGEPASGAYTQVPTAPAPPGLIGVQLERLTRLTELALTDIAALEARLEPVLRPLPPSPGDNTANGCSAEPCRLAQGLSTLGDRIEGVLAYIQRINTQLDL